MEKFSVLVVDPPRMNKVTRWLLKAKSGLWLSKWGHGCAYTNRTGFAQRFKTEAEASRNAKHGEKPVRREVYVED